MKRNDLLRDATDQLKSFDGAKSPGEAEIPYRRLNEYLIPEIDAEDHAEAMRVGGRLRELIAEKISRRRYIPAT